MANLRDKTRERDEKQGIIAHPQPSFAEVKVGLGWSWGSAIGDSVFTNCTAAAEINTKKDISKNKIDKHHPEDRVNETGDIPKNPSKGGHNSTTARPWYGYFEPSCKLISPG